MSESNSTFLPGKSQTVLDIPVIGDADSQQKVTLDMADQH
jgi:hypothetical protein